MIVLAAALFVAQTRIASDFEIAQMKQQIARSRDFLSQFSAHLNLGDLYATRAETTAAKFEYADARQIADREATGARKESNLTQYATALMYTALADAKLDNGDRAFSEAEEAIRYASGLAKSWNLYASAMSALQKPQKSVSAAMNAVAIAEHDVVTPNVSRKIDLDVYRYSLATALIDAGRANDAEPLLRRVTSDLRSSDFESLRRSVARAESFEIYSSARGDEAAYLSLVNRAGLRLAGLVEQRGDVAGARQEYERVLASRTDDPTALAALARLTTGDEQERYFVAAFDANPFSMPLIDQYREHLRTANVNRSTETSPGSRVRNVLIALQRGEKRSAREQLDTLLRDYPNNATLLALRQQSNEATSTLGQLLARLRSDQLTPSERASLDTQTFTNDVQLDNPTTSNGQTIIASGKIGEVPFRFAEPTAFRGTFGIHARLTYRILGATELSGADALLLEPLHLDPLP